MAQNKKKELCDIRINLRATSKQSKKLMLLAKKRRMSMAEVVRRLIEDEPL